MEEWEFIEELQSLYKISNKGRVYSVRKGCMSKLQDNGNGYKQICVSIKSKRKVLYVHRLVYKYFIGNLKRGMVIHHKDFDTSNNCFKNLEQVSQRENNHKSHKNKSKTSNTPCVYFESGKYVARFYVNNKSIYCGRHRTESLAKKELERKMSLFDI